MKQNPSQAMLSFEDEQTASLDLERTGSILGISTATARNWIKSGRLSISVPDGRLTFNADHVNEVRQKLATGELRRLQKRANKKKSLITFIPEEYLANKESAHAVMQILNRYREGNSELRPFLLSVILKLLEDRATTKPIQAELDWWFQGINGELSPIPLRLPKIHCDLLGLLYQSLLAEGRKAETGSYYTPSELARSMIGDHLKPEMSFLDPCCGTGLFLLHAAEVINDPQRIWGYDLDEFAVRIARINLILKFPCCEFTPNIYCCNGLLETAPSFDVIATNPPWGVHYSLEELAQLQNSLALQTNESFAFFIQAGIRLLKNDGALSILLPESFLNIRTHHEVRRRILKDTCVRGISDLGRVFKNVFTPVVRLDVRKSSPALKHSFTAHTRDGTRIIEQKRMAENEGYVFDILSNNEDRDIIDYLYNCDHLTLEGHAEWALGIVTGDNSRFLTRLNTSESEPILMGKDLRRYIAAKPSSYIHFHPEKFQQVAPVARYRAPEKLLYRFISNELVFSYDNKQTLALNSANILIPRLLGYSIKSTLAFLNSRVFQFIFQKKFKAIKVLRGDLERLPFPPISSAISMSLSKRVEALIENAEDNRTKKELFDDIDQITMDAFGLSVLQKAHIQASAKISPSFLPYPV